MHTFIGYMISCFQLKFDNYQNSVKCANNVVLKSRSCRFVTFCNGKEQQLAVKLGQLNLGHLNYHEITTGMFSYCHVYLPRPFYWKEVYLKANKYNIE